MARYRKFEVQTWTDDKFQSLSAAPPNGQTLWLYLLCGPRTTTFPGLVVAREEVIASDLSWPVEGFRKAFQEVFAKGLAKADWKGGVVVLRKALFDSLGEPRDTSRPANPNVLKGWERSWETVPECALKTEYLHSLKAFAKALGKPFEKAFEEGFGKAFAKACAQPLPIQDSGSGDRNQDTGEREEASLSPDPEPHSLRSFREQVDTTSPITNARLAHPRRPDDRRGAVARVAWNLAATTHAELTQSGIDPGAKGWQAMPSSSNPGWQLLLDRVDEVLDSDKADDATDVFAHRVAVARAEAETTRSLDYFVPTAMWNAKSFDIASHRSVESARKPARSDNRGRPDEPPRKVPSL